MLTVFHIFILVYHVKLFFMVYLLISDKSHCSHYSETIEDIQVTHKIDLSH